MKRVKPLLNWANFSFANQFGKFGETEKKFGGLSSFLTGQTFSSRTWFGQFDELRRGCVRGPKRFARHALGTVHRVRQPCVWLVRTWELSCGKGEKKTLGQQNIDDSENVLSHFGGNWLICGLAGGAALAVGPSRQKLRKWGGKGHSRGIHCRRFRPRMDDRPVITRSSIDVT